ncbi:hypothetical protein ACFP2T_27540 [Plantactinospora solaniradicis]|uniref:Uncharacterized protein n=1 Tax=Plantactinospora solaniradicis TaxID=1723736 RepID=A0ABW1KGF9_9ACTN
MIGGEWDPKVLAQMSRGVMRGKVAMSQETLRGQFEDHRVFLAPAMLTVPAS